MGTLNRRVDWPSALADYIKESEHKAYKLGEWDCLLFSMGCIATLTGLDYRPTFRNAYSTQEEAIATIKKHGRTLQEAFQSFLNLPLINPRKAQRGDIALLRDDNGEHLGIVGGAFVWFLKNEGMVKVPISSSVVVAAWKV